MTDTAPHPDLAPESPPLAGYTVAVTAARRKEELGALLDRRGARVVYAPAIRIVPLADDAVEGGDELIFIVPAEAEGQLRAAIIEPAGPAR